MRFDKMTGLAALALSAAVPVTAWANDAVAKINTVFQTSAQSGLSPATASEMALCAAVWSRWNFHMNSIPHPAMIEGLDPALSARNARKMEASWLKKSKTSYRRYEETMDGFASTRAEAEENADGYYARMMNGEGGEQYGIVDLLGTCQ